MGEVFFDFQVDLFLEMSEHFSQQELTCDSVALKRRFF